MTYEEATMIEPMACAVAGQNSLNIEKDETVIIIGSGISGLSHIQLAKNKGATVIATDISDYRIEQAINFGANYGFNAGKTNIDQIKKINNGRLADKVIVCSGSMSAVEDSFKYIDKKGKILFFAVPSSNISLPSTDLWRNEISLFFSYGAATDDIKATIELYKEKKINFKDMITHQFPLSKITEGFKLVEQAKESIKVVVKPD
jgi:L-iditol 2-dehydrogenase